ncbi:alpha-xylosidase [Enterococcus sp. JM4C]|uniref:alpha-xylosidase n=1 Tax=Candidatus Enterococcus huntleyi TaxID=1857217 RepID=UPI0013795EA0|nr:alpha-xylosidase [Enterococcus sp. JM4C]KAF1299497.1 alpha-xylosidase [Enterococcus sp. JM4C]
MKFTDGGWLVKEGFDVNYAVHVYDTRKQDNTLIFYMPYSYVGHKGFTLDGGLMTMEVSTPHADVIGVKLYNYKGVQPKTPDFHVETQEIQPVIQTEGEVYQFESGDLRVEITKGEQLNTRFYYKGQLITQSMPRSKALVHDPKGHAHISEQLSMDVGEAIYGLGERFTNFVKNGQTVDIWNADGGTGTEQAYKNIPFYVSNKGYGVFVNSPDKVSFEVGSEKVSKVQFSVPGQSMEYFIIAGDTMKDVLKNYTDLTGKPSLPPAWSFGLWLSTSFLTDYDEATVNSFVDGMLDRDIPLEVFHFDCLWMREYEWCNFTWDERTFPDPINMLRRLKEKGLKICVWINPYIGQKSPLFDEGMAKGYFLKRANGDVWQWDKWQAGMAIVDFTNPEATAWYQGKLRELIAMGVDCFKTDFGERIPVDAVYADGSDPEKMHNYYAYLYNKIVYDLIVEEKGKEEAILFARSASVGSQTLPVHWGGDSTSDYPSMAETLRAGLSFGLGGFGYWSHDISGFEAGATPDLYKRWTQFGLLSSHSRYHGSWEYKVPWIYGEEAVDVARYFTKLKLRLMPYLQAQSVKTSEVGLPMMRAMVLEFTDDIATHQLDQQYMFGDDLLVAPVFNDAGQVKFYVPNTKGIWTDHLTGKRYAGGQWYQETVDYFHLSLLARPNAIIIEGNTDNQAVYDYTEAPTIHVYELDTDATASALVYNEHGEKVGAVSAKHVDGKVKVTLEGIKEATVVLHGEETKEVAAKEGVTSI